MTPAYSTPGAGGSHPSDPAQRGRTWHRTALSGGAQHSTGGWEGGGSALTSEGVDVAAGVGLWLCEVQEERRLPGAHRRGSVGGREGSGGRHRPEVVGVVVVRCRGLLLGRPRAVLVHLVPAGAPQHGAAGVRRLFAAPRPPAAAAPDRLRGGRLRGAQAKGGEVARADGLEVTAPAAALLAADPGVGVREHRRAAAGERGSVSSREAQRLAPEALHLARHQVVVAAQVRDDGRAGRGAARRGALQRAHVGQHGGNGGVEARRPLCAGLVGLVPLNSVAAPAAGRHEEQQRRQHAHGSAGGEVRTPEG